MVNDKYVLYCNEEKIHCFKWEIDYYHKYEIPMAKIYFHPYSGYIVSENFVLFFENLEGGNNDGILVDLDSTKTKKMSFLYRPIQMCVFRQTDNLILIQVYDGRYSGSTVIKM